METKFKPNYAIHPGTILEDDLRISKISQRELSKRIGISTTIINEIIKGKRSINARFAVLLEGIFPYEASYWLGLQSFYEETVARLELDKENHVDEECCITLWKNKIDEIVFGNRCSFFEDDYLYSEAVFCKAS